MNASGPRVLLIDNYDSFTYNLAHMPAGARGRGHRPSQRRDRRERCRRARAHAPRHLARAQGPADAGASVEIVRRVGAGSHARRLSRPMQAIVEAYGGEVGLARRLVHGKASLIEHDGQGLFRGLLSPLEGGATTPGRHAGARLAGGVRDDRRRRGDGRTAPRAPRRRHPVPSGIGADAARPRDRPALPGGRAVIQLALARLLDGRDLTRSVRAVMDQIMDGEATARQTAPSSSRSASRARRRTRSPAARKRCVRTCSPCARSGRISSTPRAPGRRRADVQHLDRGRARRRGRRRGRREARQPLRVVASGSADVLEALV